MRTLLLIPIVICTAAAIAALAVVQSPPINYRPSTVIPRALPPITDAAVVPGKSAKIDDEELVIGVVIDGQARAYPVNQLTGPDREIINDELAGTAIAATW